MPRQKKPPIAPAARPTKAQVVLEGLYALIEGQKRFASEFGLNLQRVLPATFESVQAGVLPQRLALWLNEEQKEGGDELRYLFAELINHQLALIAALDGITLQTLRELTGKYQQLNGSMQRMQYWLLNPTVKNIEMFKTDQQLRYQKLIMPGMADGYLLMLEKLRQ